MKTINIRSITMKSFKGFSETSHDFSGVTELRAETGAGKSSYFQAWCWCLGLNVNDVEPTTENKTQIPDLETSVSIIVDIDGLEYTLARKSNQKWRVNKETQTRSFDGNETQFFIDGIDCKANVYKDKIADLFGVEYAKLEMLINLPYFNSTNGTKWTWKERRQVLYTLCGVDEIVKQLFDKESYSMIAADLKKGYSTVDITKSINNEKKFINEGKTRNETLITAKGDELSKYSSHNYDTLQAEIDKAEKSLQNLLAANNKAIKNTLVAEKLAEIEKLTAQLSKLQIAQSKATQERNGELSRINGQLNTIKMQGNADKAELEQLANTIARFEKMIFDKSEESYNGQVICPTCQRQLPETDIATLTRDYELTKSKQLKELHTSLANATQRHETLTASINAQRTQYSDLKAKYDLLQSITTANGEIVKLEETISEMRTEAQKMRMAEVNTDKDEKIAELKAKISELKGQYAYKTVAENIRNEIERLRNESKELTNREITNEKKRRQLENYVAETISLVNQTINDKFDGVKFRLFNTLTANAEKAFEEDCEVEYEGVTYGSLSNGQRIMANFLTMLGLQRIYNVSFPVFVDEKQSLTIDLKCEQQLICLITTKTNKNLTGTKIKDIYKVKGE